MNVAGPWYGDIAVMEKLDGLVCSVLINLDQGKDGIFARDYGGAEAYVHPRAEGGTSVHPDILQLSNTGFFEWVEDNAGNLFKALGTGLWRGVWWGAGIGRGYRREDRSFALYAPEILTPDTLTDFDHLVDGMAHAPTLYVGSPRPENGQDPVGEALRRLQFAGSAAARGFKPAAGVLVTMLESKVSFSVDL